MLPEALAHLLPFQHGPASDPYVVIALMSAGVFASALAGLLVARAVQGRGSLARLAPGFSAGALLFLFFDLLKEAASLGQGLVRDPLLQAVLLAAFAAGALFIPTLSAGGSLPPRVAWLWAFGIALHGAGEGWLIGTEATTAGVVAPLGVTSFLLHKAIEGFTIPLVAGTRLAPRDAGIMAGMLALVAAAAGAAGFASGSGTAPLAFFAAGAGAVAFAILRLGREQRLGAIGTAALVLGVAVVYLAGVLHEL